MKTEAEVEELKRSWSGDPCWDIEDTEGFEEWRDELYQYRIRMEKIWEHQRLQRFKDRAHKLGLDRFMDYIEKLETRISKLEELHP